MDISNL